MDGPQPWSPGEIVVGLPISLTGRFSVQARQALDGLRLWQSYVNGGEGITIDRAVPRRVRLVFYDHQSCASLARENALRLLRQDRVDALFGPYSSGLTITVAEVARQHRKILWNHGGSSDEIFNRGWHHLVSPRPQVAISVTFHARWQGRHLLCVRSASYTPLMAHSPPT